MAQTLPIPAGQPLDATRTAAGQVVTLAGAEAVAVQAAASLTLAALLWPLIPAARAMAGLASALGEWLPLRPLPEQQVVVMPGSGGAGRPATVPGGAPGAVRAAGAITLGVEEEFVLLDPSTGATVLAGPDLVRMLGGEPGVQQELMRFQVETGTRVCTSLDDVGRELIRLRRLAAAAAASVGCRLVACGVAPYRTPGLAAVTDQPRYRELARRYGPVVAEAGTCGCHVHVGVPSREAGVQVLARLRPWLAPLLAVCANSPIAGGRDTGWATIEVRVADVCLDAGTAVLLAGLTRALVATALAEARRGPPAAAAPARQVAAALAAAARHGLAGAGIDPARVIGFNLTHRRSVEGPWPAGSASATSGSAQSGKTPSDNSTVSRRTRCSPTPSPARAPTVLSYAVPPAAWPDAAAYDTAVRRLIGQGAALDERSVYFLARLSPRYPSSHAGRPGDAQVCPCR